MTKYAIVDTANTFFRARHVAGKQADTFTKLGFAIHLTLASVLKVYRDYGAEHVVFCLEGRSWRKDFYEPYKKNRVQDQSEMTEAQIEEDQLFWQTYDELCTYLRDRTNCTVLRCPTAEADDLIARWIQLHPDDEHVIVSSDSDFYQLISGNVTQYNGVRNEHITLEGVFNDRGKPIKDKKTGEPKTIGDPEWLLFEKCIRGDGTDNVFSAYPGARKKGSKNKVGMFEAFEDSKTKGFNWNNFMLQKWTDHNDVEHRVLDDYQRNVTLIDLTAQPDDVKQAIDTSILEQITDKHKPMVGAQFMKFCGQHELIKLSEQATLMGQLLANAYQGPLNEHNRETHTEG